MLQLDLFFEVVLVAESQEIVFNLNSRLGIFSQYSLLKLLLWSREAGGGMELTA